MSSGCGGLGVILAVAPGGGLVVEGAGLEASVEDADEPVGYSPEGIGMSCFRGRGARRSRRVRWARRSGR